MISYLHEDYENYRRLVVRSLIVIVVGMILLIVIEKISMVAALIIGPLGAIVVYRSVNLLLNILDNVY